MDDTVIAGHLENLDRRLARVEQILPTLATKEELREEGERLRRHIDIVDEALRTDIQLVAEHLREESERSRRHMDVVGEALRTDIQLLAEHLASMRPKPRKG